MKPSITLASTQTASGETLECIRHDQDLYLYLDRQPICSTRAYEPETALARAAYERTRNYRAPKILLAGLGLGHCLREILTLAPKKASIHVAETMKILIDWNRELLGEKHRSALQDDRLHIHTSSASSTIRQLHQKLDAILLSTHPSITTASRNTLRICAAQINPKGIVCVKASRDQASQIKGVLESCRLRTIITPIGARPNARARTHAIICAAQRSEYLPSASETA